MTDNDVTPLLGVAARATMTDVAALAGVSLKTVSRVVNHETPVSEETRQAVERAIAQLRFRRNHGAASLRQGQTTTIGLILEDLEEPFQARLARAVERVAVDEGFFLYVASSSYDATREKQTTLSMCGRRVDGLIIIPSLDDYGYLRTEIDAGLSVVFVDRPPAGLTADTVHSDHREGARMGVSHLIEHGHRRIVFMGDSEEVYTSRERLHGYRDALALHGIEPDESLIHLGVPDPARADHALRATLDTPNPATALFTASIFNSFAAIRSARYSEGGQIPHVGFDDFDTYGMLSPRLTVVSQDPSKIGEQAAQLLFKRLRGAAEAPKNLTIETRLIQRGTGEL